ncbi:Poly(A) polymerase PAPa, partial [Candida tropicalis]
MNGINSGSKTWSDLFERHDFFFRYKFYLCIVAATKSNSEEHLKYGGMVESKLRLLVQKLELVEGIELAHPYVKTFEDGFLCKDSEEVSAVVNSYGTLEGESLTKSIPRADSIKKDEEKQESKVEVHLTKLFIGLKIDLQKDTGKKLDIQYPCTEFFNICKGWQDYDSEKHFIQIKKVKLHDLSNDVYIEGEIRPTKV